MTPAPISVERLPEKWRRPPTKAGVEWIEANARRQCAYELEQALPALLHQLAEREAEVERLREIASQINTDWIPANKKLAERAETAERARGDAAALVARVVNNTYWRTNDNKLWPDLIAFIAASGGA